MALSFMELLSYIREVNAYYYFKIESAYLFMYIRIYALIM